MAARKVLDKNGILADKLSREIVAKDQLELRKTKELMASIRNMAVKRIDNKFMQCTEYRFALFSFSNICRRRTAVN
jgi:hypothetical protein